MYTMHELAPQDDLQDDGKNYECDNDCVITK